MNDKVMFSLLAQQRPLICGRSKASIKLDQGLFVILFSPTKIGLLSVDDGSVKTIMRTVRRREFSMCGLSFIWVCAKAIDLADATK